jgi:hypothetical protein
MSHLIKSRLYSSALFFVCAAFCVGSYAADEDNSQVGVERETATTPSPAESERQIVVITEPEFVPISHYFEAVIDPNTLEPSAAGTPAKGSHQFIRQP